MPLGTSVYICAAGKQTINTMYGTRVAVLAGDFLFAQSSWFLANLDNLEVRRQGVCSLAQSARHRLQTAVWQ